MKRFLMLAAMLSAATAAYGAAMEKKEAKVK